MVGVPQPLLRAGARVGRRGVRLLGRHAVEEAEEERQEGRAVRHRQDLGQGLVPQPLRPPALVHHRSSRASSRGWSGATPSPRATGSREQIEGYMREVPCPACGGAPAAGVARGHDRRQEHLRGRRALDPQGGGVPRLARAVRARPHDRRAGREGGQRAAAVPARRRPRLPQPQPVVGHARRR